MKWIILLILILPSVQALGGTGTSENYESYIQISGGGTNTTSEGYENDLLIGEITGDTSSENYKICLGFFCMSRVSVLTDKVKDLKQYFPLVLLLIMIFVAINKKWTD